MKQQILHYLFPRQFLTYKKPSDVLIGLQDKKHQLFGQYVQYDWNEKKVSGYCAMGLLACQADLVNPDWDNHTGRTSFNNTSIFSAYGLEAKTEDEFPCPASILGHDKIDEDGDRVPCNEEYQYIGDMVVHLNDAHKWTFKEIGLSLKELGY